MKSSERSRLAALKPRSFEIFVQDDTIIPVRQNDFLANEANKIKFIKKLSEKFLSKDGILGHQALDDANMPIIQKAISMSKYCSYSVQIQKYSVAIDSYDIDVLIILIALCSP